MRGGTNVKADQGGAPRNEDQCSVALGRTTIIGASLLLLAAVGSVVAVPTVNIVIVAVTLLVFGIVYMGLGVGAYRLAKKQQGERELVSGRRDH